MGGAPAGLSELAIGDRVEADAFWVALGRSSAWRQHHRFVAACATLLVDPIELALLWPGERARLGCCDQFPPGPSGRSIQPLADERVQFAEPRFAGVRVGSAARSRRQRGAAHRAFPLFFSSNYLPAYHRASA